MRTIICLLLFFLCLVSVFAQIYSENEYIIKWLYNLNSYSLNRTIDHDLQSYSYDFCWATSCFPPDTSAPPEPEDISWSPMGVMNNKENREATRSELEAYYRYINWLYLYAPFKARDGESDTAWVENKYGAGINEVLLVPVDCTREVSIWAGFGKSNTLYLKNNRPKRVRVYVIEILEKHSAQISDFLVDLKIRGKHEVVLKDVNGYQTLELPDFTLEERLEIYGEYETRTLLAIEILSVYPGTAWDDTCISEVTNR